MLTIELNGAQALLDQLLDIQKGNIPDDPALEAVLEVNAFFVEFYSGWEGCSRAIIRQAVRCFNQPEKVPAGTLPQRLAEGFRQAMDEIEAMKSRLIWLKTIDASDIATRILAFLPTGTPLESTIHITIDLFNNAFAYRNEMGVSLLYAAQDRQTFEQVVMHELHHVGFQYWSERDKHRQRLLQGETGQAVAVKHIQNLLMEGMANYYCSPGYVFGKPGDAAPEGQADPYQTRLSRLQQEERSFFSQAEAALALCLKPDVPLSDCWEAYNAIAMDMVDFMLPAGHYLGARMLQTLDQAYSREEILGFVQRLDGFLPAYNTAARQAGGYVFDDSLVNRFAHLLLGVD